MKVEFCEDNSGTSKKMRYFLKNKVGTRAPRAPPLDPPLFLTLEQDFDEDSMLKYTISLGQALAHKAKLELMTFFGRSVLVFFFFLSLCFSRPSYSRYLLLFTSF